ncbi:hypothetical protein CEXT_664371 [Caerostris extrusa]|uniref:Uncharacterized protein n=1 Tax=Caerostris extrusa TaxID=172846 RepID=A0AAV4X1E5_CAEEX|nr:hypothetical protein CEXT_664371 [Caerostris extrusa]
MQGRTSNKWASSPHGSQAPGRRHDNREATGVPELPLPTTPAQVLHRRHPLRQHRTQPQQRPQQQPRQPPHLGHPAEGSCQGQPHEGRGPLSTSQTPVCVRPTPVAFHPSPLYPSRSDATSLTLGYLAPALGLETGAHLQHHPQGDVAPTIRRGLLFQTMPSQQQRLHSVITARGWVDLLLHYQLMKWFPILGNDEICMRIEEKPLDLFEILILRF